jgi:hypothetical protein
MPMMEADAGLALRAACWLAAANYFACFVGALCAARLSLVQARPAGFSHRSLTAGERSASVITTGCRCFR